MAADARCTGPSVWRRRWVRQPRSSTSTRAPVPAGSHKLNTAVAQAYYDKKDGIKRLATETGAGQWGSALALGCHFMGLECKVYMVKVSYYQKPYRRILMETWGEGRGQPQQGHRDRKKILAEDPNSPGSLGIAISEAMEDAFSRDDTITPSAASLTTSYCTRPSSAWKPRNRWRWPALYPDIIIGCIGGGSNFAGLCLALRPDKIKGKKIQIVAVEPTACPSITKGPYAWDYGDVAGMAPIAKMYTLGHTSYRRRFMLADCATTAWRQSSRSP